MIEKIMKAVKSSNKRRGRNITIGAVVGFLLSCTAVMGADDYLWIKGDSGKIEFNKAETTASDGSWNKGNPYEDAGNIWNTVKKTYTNNIALSSNAANGNDMDIDISYGLRLSGGLTNVNFVNNSSITGKVSSGSGDGYGIYNSAEMGNIKNAGEISGSGISGGYGIYNKSGTIGGITNTGEISGSGTGNINASGDGFGYGINNESGTIGGITNTGEISGTGKSASTGKGHGYGIYNSGTMENITNTGIISGTGIGYGSYIGEGYGINNYSTSISTVGAITNTGLIIGIGTSSSGDGEGYGINNYSSGTMGAITNTGIISGIGKDSSGDNKGYGINNKSGTMGAITNAGIISGSGNGVSSGNGYGIYNGSSSTMGAITNIGIINGTGANSGYGIGNYTSAEMGNIENTGIISGTGTSSNSVGSGYGIMNYSTSTMGAITNTGIISGTGNGGSGTGYGIHNDSSSTMGAITNIGVIYGKDNAIKNEKSDNITVNNYGILVNGKDQDVNAGINGTDYGLTIKNGTITSGNDATNSSVDIAIEYAEDGKVIKSRSMTIKNANIEGGSGTGTSTESIELGNNNYDNYILNGKDKTLKVTGSNDKITGSIINAYGTAVVFGDTGDKELTLSGTIVNGGIEDSTNGIAISGSSNGDNLILQSGEIEYKINEEKKSATQNTVVNGNIDM